MWEANLSSGNLSKVAEKALSLYKLFHFSKIFEIVQENYCQTFNEFIEKMKIFGELGTNDYKENRNYFTIQPNYEKIKEKVFDINRPETPS